jgi:lipopolysaccharide transport system ATP-binding protein
MATVNRLCQRAILLESGRIKADGDVHSVTGLYMVSDTGTTAARRWEEPPLRPGDDVARLISVRVLQSGVISESVDIRMPVEVEMVYEVLVDQRQLLASFAFFDMQGIHLFAAADFPEGEWSGPRARGRYRSVCTVPGNLWAEGVVRVVAEVSTRHPVYQIHFLVFDSVAFQVVDTGEPGSVRAGWGRPIPGVMRPACEWRTSVDRIESAAGLTPQPLSRAGG